MSYARIAARLNELGVPTRTGKRWFDTTIRRIEKGELWKEVKVKDYKAEIARMKS